MSGASFQFGDFTLDLRRGSLSRGGVDIALRPKSFELLVLLVHQSDQLLTKQSLMDALWPDVVVTDDSLTRCVSDVRAALGKEGAGMVQTVPRRGYRFVAQVSVGSDESVTQQVVSALSPLPATSASSAPSTEPAAPPARRRHSPTLWAVAVVCLLLAAGLLGWLLPERQSSAPQLSVLVLPFTTLGADESTPAGLGTVVASDLTGALAKLRGSSVIAADSARVLLGRSWDPRDLGRDWHVRHVVSGSIARSERGWRINAQLIDTATGANRWADRFDVERQDLGPALDAIVLRLAGALGAELVQSAARQPLRDATAADAETLAIRCEAATFTRVDQSAQPDLAACDQALARDPGNVRALSTLAYFHATRVSRVQSPDAKADLTLARQQVDRALAAAPEDHAVHCAHSVVLEGETKLSEAVLAAERCLALNPSASRAYLKLATLYFFLAQPERTIAYANRGLQLSPRDPESSTFVLFQGWAHFMLGQDQEALRWLRQAEAAAPRAPNVHAALASLLALSGEDAEARATLARYLALPETRARTIAQWNYRPGSSPAFLAFDQRFKAGLRRAGLPER